MFILTAARDVSSTQCINTHHSSPLAGLTQPLYLYLHTRYIYCTGRTKGGRQTFHHQRVFLVRRPAHLASEKIGVALTDPTSTEAKKIALQTACYSGCNAPLLGE